MGGGYQAKKVCNSEGYELTAPRANNLVSANRPTKLLILYLPVNANSITAGRTLAELGIAHAKYFLRLSISTPAPQSSALISPYTELQVQSDPSAEPFLRRAPSTWTLLAFP